MENEEIGPSQTPPEGYVYPNLITQLSNGEASPSDNNSATIGPAAPAPAPEPLCFNPRVGLEQTTLGDATHTGPGGQIRIGECSGPGTFDVNGEVSAGKVTTQVGSSTIENEGPNVKAGLAFNPRGENRIGAQANVASASWEKKLASGEIQKVGLSSGVGAELRVHAGPNGIEGAGADVGPVGFDNKLPQAPLRLR